MSNKLEISRELIEEVVAQLDDFITGDVLEQLKSALAAPVVERQEPLALSQQVAAKYAKLNELAVEAALSATARYSYMPKDKDENWKPHSWVIAAMDKAVQFYSEQPAPVAAPHTMKSVMKAVCAARNFPMLTSNQCQSLADALNEGVDKVKELNQ